MSYSEENGQVVLRMSREDYEKVLLMLELTRWIWDKYVGVPVAGEAWGQEYENLLDRVRRMVRSLKAQRKE